MKVGTIGAAIPITFAGAVETFTSTVVVIGNAASMCWVVMPVARFTIMDNRAVIVKTVRMMIVAIHYHHPTVAPVTTTEEKVRADINTRAPIKTGNIGITGGMIPINRWVI
jgi:hypothetical protein